MITNKWYSWSSTTKAWLRFYTKPINFIPKLHTSIQILYQAYWFNYHLSIHAIYVQPAIVTDIQNIFSRQIRTAKSEHSATPDSAPSKLSLLALTARTVSWSLTMTNPWRLDQLEHLNAILVSSFKWSETVSNPKSPFLMQIFVV